MEKLVIPSHGWVVVCDAANAQILRNEGDALEPKLEALHALSKHQTHGNARSSTGPTNLHLLAEEAFLGDLAAHLDRSVYDHAVTSMILVAPPQALGILRKHLKPATRKKVAAEIAKDITKLSVPEIEAYLLST